MATPELNPCPFCKSDDVEVIEKKSRGACGKDKFSYYVKCHFCHARGPSFGCNGKNNKTWRGFAVYQWNSVGANK